MTTLIELSLEAEAALARFSTSGPDAAAISVFHNIAVQMHSIPPAWASDKIDAMLARALSLFGPDAPAAHPGGEDGLRHALMCDLQLIRDIDRRYQRTAA